MTVDERLRFITSNTSRTLGSGYPPAWNFKSIQKKEEHLNCTCLHGKKKGVMEAAKGLLVAFGTALTLILLIALFGVWTSAASIGGVVRRKSRRVKDPSDWFVISRN
jgi:hypothetical protein